MISFSKNTTGLLLLTAAYEMKNTKDVKRTINKRIVLK